MKTQQVKKEPEFQGKVTHVFPDITPEENQRRLDHIGDVLSSIYKRKITVGYRQN